MLLAVLCSVYIPFLFSFPPTQWLIVTLALYALLLTINGLSVFLNDWASRGEVERIGLLQSVNEAGTVTPIETTPCDSSVDCLFLKSRIQAVAVLMLMAFVMNIAGFFMSLSLIHI